MMDKSESIVELAKALSKAQGEMGGALKSSNNPFFKSSYSALPEVVEAVKVPFSTNGLSYSQFPIYADGFAGVTTILMHSSGEWMKSDLLLPVAKKDPQAVGSAITYARRYALQAVAGIPSEDDDGNAATHGSAAVSKSSPEKDLIAEAIKNKDSDFVKSNWTGLIADQWPHLEYGQAEKLNQLFNM